MRTALALLLLAASQFCLAQKWVDENGKVYYGTPPAGVYVRPAPMSGGASSTVGAQQQPVSPSAARQVQPDDWLERAREAHRRQQEENEARRQEQVAPDPDDVRDAISAREQARREREEAQSEREYHWREIREQERERAAGGGRR